VIFENSSVDVLYNLDGLADVQVASLFIYKTYTGKIGLPKWNATGYAEYRQDYLQFDGVTAGFIYANSGRIKLDLLTNNASNIFIDSAGSATENGVPAIILKGAHASNVLTLQKGDTGLAVFASEAATFPVIKTGYVAAIGTDAKLLLGTGVTLSGTTITQGGGTISANSALSAITQTAGTFTSNGSMTITTMNLNGDGKFICKSSGTITTINARDRSTVDFSQDIRTRTVTTFNRYSDLVTVKDPAETVTWTNGIDNEGCGRDLSKLELGINWKLSKAAVS